MVGEHKSNQRKTFVIMSSLSVVVFLSLVFTIMPLNQVDASEQTEFRGKDYKDAVAKYKDALSKAESALP